MRIVAVALLAVIALTVIGCQPPEGMAGVTQEQFDELKAKVDGLQTDIGMLQTALDSLTSIYNAHVEKSHKGGAVAPKPPASTTPPKVKIK